MSPCAHYASRAEACGVELESHSGDTCCLTPDWPGGATWSQSSHSGHQRSLLLPRSEARRRVPTAGVLDSLEADSIAAAAYRNRNLYAWNNQNEDLSCRPKRPSDGIRLGRPFARVDGSICMTCVLHGHAILWCWKDDYEERWQVAGNAGAGERALAELYRPWRQDRYRARGHAVVVFNFHAAGHGAGRVHRGRLSCRSGT